MLTMQFSKKSETMEGKFPDCQQLILEKKILLSKIIRRLSHKDYATVMI